MGNHLNYSFIGCFWKMHGNTKAPGEGMSRNASHIQLDGSGAPATTVTTWNTTVSTYGAWITEEPWTCGVDVGQV